MASPQTGHSYFRHTFAAISMTTMKYAKSSSNLARKKALCVCVCMYKPRKCYKLLKTISLEKIFLIDIHILDFFFLTSQY